ncbi:hypothetical protein N431DRAFT_444815 [Stipitochalara longipes BDJ]|nr:hypothetical protein N431DRAFT_444815 [Stipitochalara longipes BDJ]
MDDLPFITLAAGGISPEASPSPLNSEDASETSSQEIPSSISSLSIATHDISRTKYHLHELGTFAARLEHAAASIFPNKGRSRYENVHVLLLRWEEDSMGVQYELDDLAKSFETGYGYATETWLIPSAKSHFALMEKALQVVRNFGKADSLLIVYYAGHGHMNASRQAMWSCTSDNMKGSLSWHAVQALFEQADSDILLLLDCCAAASGALTEASSTSVTETIAACGFETWAPQPGRHSFTNTLIAVLDDWCDRSAFTAAMLHCEILNRLRHEKPERYRNTKSFEFRKSPIHVLSTNDPKARSIELAPRPSPQDVPVNELAQDNSSPPKKRGVATSRIVGTPTIEIEPSEGRALLPIPTDEQTELYNMDSLTKVLDDGHTSLPHVLLSLALEGDQVLDFERCRKWLQDFPAFARYATVQGVFKSNSTLLILSLPVVIWDWLPDDPACTFIGYVHSQNLIPNELRQRLPWAMNLPQVPPLSHSAYKVMRNDAMLQESRKSIAQAASLDRLAVFSIVFLTVTFTARFFNLYLEHSYWFTETACLVFSFGLLLMLSFAASLDLGHLAALRRRWISARSIKRLALSLVVLVIKFLDVTWAMLTDSLAGGRRILKSHWKLLFRSTCFIISIYFVDSVKDFVVKGMVSDTAWRAVAIALVSIGYFVLYLIPWLWLRGKSAWTNRAPRACKVDTACTALDDTHRVRRGTKRTLASLVNCTMFTVLVLWWSLSLKKTFFPNVPSTFRDDIVIFEFLVAIVLTEFTLFMTLSGNYVWMYFCITRILFLVSMGTSNLILS